MQLGFFVDVGPDVKHDDDRLASAGDSEQSTVNDAKHGIDFVEAQKMKKRGISQTRALSAARLDEIHDAGENLGAHLDLAKATRPGRDVQRVNVDFPVDLLHAIDREAKRIGVSRQAFIKLRLADTLMRSH